MSIAEKQNIQKWRGFIRKNLSYRRSKILCKSRKHDLDSFRVLKNNCDISRERRDIFRSLEYVKSLGRNDLEVESVIRRYIERAK